MPLNDPIVRTSGDAVSDRLSELGLSVPLLRQALERGQYAADEVTANHPRNFEGIAKWAETNRALRDLLVPDGWTRSDVSNIPRTVAPDDTYCLFAVSGDKGTGQPHMEPSTKRPRGSASAEAVTDNCQLELFPDLFDDDQDSAHRRKTWLLLYHTEDERVRAELSLPIRVSQEGAILRWAERLILPDIDLSDGMTGDTGRDPTPSLEVSVEPRS